MQLRQRGIGRRTQVHQTAENAGETWTTPPTKYLRTVLVLRPADAIGSAMPPRLPLRAQRAPALPSTAAALQALVRRFASSSATTPEFYDVVCVGGGPAGLSLLTGLRNSPITSGLKVALIEGQDLSKNRLPKDAPLDSFSNRCSSLTPASVKNLQGMRSCACLLR
jgi:hypothetical protein